MSKILVTDEMREAALRAWIDSPGGMTEGLAAVIEAALAVAPAGAATNTIPDELVDIFDAAWEAAQGETWRANVAAGLAAVFDHLGSEVDDDEDDEAVRLACLELAVRSQPSDYALRRAREFYSWVSGAA